MKKYKLIANPHAGRGRASGIVADVVRLFNARKARFDLETTRESGDAENMAAIACTGDEYAAVISIGGDGTVNDVIQKAVFTGKPIGVIPAGSGNDFAKVLNTPKKLDDIVDMLLAGRTKVIDVGKMNKRFFANNIGIGFDAVVNYNTRKVKWIRSGLAMYVCALLITLDRYRPLPMKITINGEVFDQNMFLVSVGNGTTCGGGFKLTPHAKIDDQLLDITMIKPLNLLQLLRHFPKVFLGTIDKTQYTVTRRTEKLTVESIHPLPVHMDGEIYAFKDNTCEISVVPAALTIIGNFI
ncbi:MAG TPA: diacylglycerol kinase family protein [Nitrospirota bacterium]|nr:diacylglycerol kinase family protein [Nitrospirota bacterium]